MTTQDLTAAQFNETVNGNDIVLVDFWASWCGPCRQFAPTFAASAEKHPDVVHAKVDTEAEQELAAAAQIRSIPTLMAFKKGKLIFNQAGALPPAALEDLVQQVKEFDVDAAIAAQRATRPEPLCMGAGYRSTVSMVLVEHPRPQVALITLNRPERMNSMAFDVMVPLKEALESINYDNSVRVVVLTGAGAGFSSGADHKSAGDVPHVAGLTRPTYALRSMQILDDVILALRRLHQPVIAAVNGAAIGGGLCLALAADIRVASSGAYFRAAGINNGLTASELGLSYLLPRAIGSSRAFEIMLTGRDIDAEEAERIGLVSRHVPEDQLLETCYDMAERIAAFSRPGVELTKRTLWSGLDAASLEGHMQAEGLGQLFVRLLTTNFEEAVAARAEKRPPVFTDDKQ